MFLVLDRRLVRVVVWYVAVLGSRRGSGESVSGVAEGQTIPRRLVAHSSSMMTEAQDAKHGRDH